MTAPVLPVAGLLRRLGALLYDTLLVLAVLMAVTLLFLPLTGGEAITPAQSGALETVYQLVLLVLIVAFFGWFWVNRGQTLGMAAWRLRIERDDGGPLTWTDSLKRLGAACLSWLPGGLGFLWVLLDRDRLAWHDRLSRTRLVVEPKKK